MQTKKKMLVDLILLIIIGLVSLVSFFSFSEKISSLSGLINIVMCIYFYTYKIKMKLSRIEVGLNEKKFFIDVKNNWFLIVIPSILNFVAVGLSRIVMPDYINHVIGRVDGTLSLDKIILLVCQLVLLAFIEETVWRGLVQKRLSSYMKVPFAIIITSIFFAIAHPASGNASIVAYDLFFIFCNSIFYGMVFHKTNNIYVSTLSHFIANLSGVFILLYFL